MMGLWKWYKNLEDRVCSPVGTHPDDDPELQYKAGDRVLCTYGHYEAEVVTIKEIRIEPENKNIGPFIYVCEASDGEKLTLGPLDFVDLGGE